MDGMDCDSNKEAIHIRINIPAFNHILGTDRSSSKSNHMVDSNLPHGHTHLTISSNRLSRTVYLAS